MPTYRIQYGAINGDRVQAPTAEAALALLNDSWKVQVSKMPYSMDALYKLVNGVWLRVVDLRETV